METDQKIDKEISIPIVDGEKKNESEENLINKTQKKKKSEENQKQQKEEGTEGKKDGKDTKEKQEEGKEEKNEKKNEENIQQTITDDIEKSEWYYLDEKYAQQGPYTFEQVSQWWSSGFFQPQMCIRRVNEEQWSYIGYRYEFTTYLYHRDYMEYYHKLQQQKQREAVLYGGVGGKSSDYKSFSFPEQINTHHSLSEGIDSEKDTEKTEDSSTDEIPKYNDLNDGLEYVSVGSFNVRSGRWQSMSPNIHWNTRNLPSDREGRQMSHYFDVEAYQEQKRKAAAEMKNKKKKKKKIK